MRPIFLNSILLFLVSSDCLYGQCLTNGTFANACDPTSTNQVYGASGSQCPTWDDACGAGWIRSNGTPQMIPNSNAGRKETLIPFFAYMWSAYGQYDGATQSYGEGMYTPFTFTAGQGYDVRILFNVTGSSTANGAAAPASGTLYVYAANGLTEHALDGCGDLVPNISSKQLIGSYTFSANETQDILFTPFVPNANYTQLWMYPASNSTAVQDNLMVTAIFDCPSCRNTVIYNTGTVPVTVEAGDIYAGSSAGSGGSGIVGVQSGSATAWVAGNAVYLEPSFQASVTGSGSFTAQIIPCGTNPNTIASTAAPDIYDTINTAAVIVLDSVAGSAGTAQHLTGTAKSLLSPTQSQPTGMAPARFLVYPTVSSGVVNITGSTDDLGNSNIVVYDELGRLVYELYNAASTNVMLDLSNLANGYYFIQVRSGTRQNVQKIIISR